MSEHDTPPPDGQIPKTHLGPSAAKAAAAKKQAASAETVELATSEACEPQESIQIEPIPIESVLRAKSDPAAVAATVSISETPAKDPLPDASVVPKPRPASDWKARLRRGLAEHESARESRSGETAQVGKRFEVIRELGRGGMGVVFECEDRVLGRRVALKVLLAGEFATDEALERFQIEARAAARLSHRNIVGVHEVGEEDGRNFMVMDLIEGEGLEKLLKREGVLAPQRAAEITLKLARALGYAHKRSILHRDLKPSNVLITPEGEPLLTDFGLAKEFERTGGALTTSGHVMGTPAYMSPEQASGQPVDPRSDLYSLGATLYELLSGRPPFSGQNVASILSSVLQSEPAPLSALRPGLDRDLETICLKCLEKEPKLRYANAEDLADDLQRFTQHQSIRARRPRLVERGSKWLRRNRVLAKGVAMTGGLALVLLVGSGVAFVDRVRHERNRFEQAALEADQERERAQEAAREAQRERNRAQAAAEEAAREGERARLAAREANAALNMLVYEVRDTLKDLGSPQVREVRRRLLASAVERLEALQSLEEEDAGESGHKACDAYRQIGDLARTAGESDRAATLYDKALAIAREQWKASGEQEWAREVSVCLLRVVDIRVHRGDWEGALQPATEAVEILSKSGGGPEITFALGRLAGVYLALGKPERALRIYQTELRIARASVGRVSDATAAERSVAAALLHVGEAHEALGDLKAALEHYEGATTRARAIFQADPTKLTHARDLRAVLLRAGDVYLEQGKLKEARAVFAEGCELDRAWVARDPSHMSAAEAILASLGRLGDAAYRQGDLKAARAAYQDLETRARALRGRDVNSEEALHSLQAAIGRVSSLKKLDGDLQGALEGFQEVHALATDVLARFPERVSAQRSLSSVLMQLGDVLAAQGRLGESIEALERCLALRRSLLSRRASEVTAQTELANTLCELIEAYDVAGRDEESLRAGQEGIALARKILEKESTNDTARRALFLGLDRLGTMRLFQGQVEEALKLFEEAKATAKLLVERDATSVRARRSYATSLVNTATALRRLERVDEARAHYEQALTLRRALIAAPGASPKDHRKLAICLSGLADLDRGAGDFEAAERTYREVLETHRGLLRMEPTSENARRDVFIALMRLGMVRHERHDWDGALARYAEAAETRRRDYAAQRNPAARADLYQALLRRAQLLRARTRFEPAAAAFRELIELQAETLAEAPQDAKRRRTLIVLCVKQAEVLKRIEAWEELMPTLRRAVREAELQAKAQPSFRGLLAQIRAFLQRETSAEALRAGKREPTNDAERLHLAKAHLVGGRHAEALALYERALADAEHRQDLNHSHLHHAARAAARAGKLELAMAWLKEDVGRRRAAIANLGQRAEAAQSERDRKALEAAGARLEAWLAEVKQTEPAFEVLRARADFKELFAEPTAPSAESPPAVPR